MPVRPEMRHHYTTPEWRALSLRIRKERAGDRCECVGECGTWHFGENVGTAAEGTWRCSALEAQPHPVTGSKVKLTVGHRDHDPTHNHESNLAAWCQACHNRHDANYRKQNANRTRRSKKAAGDLFGETADGV